MRQLLRIPFAVLLLGFPPLGAEESKKAPNEVYYQWFYDDYTYTSQEVRATGLGAAPPKGAGQEHHRAADPSNAVPSGNGCTQTNWEGKDATGIWNYPWVTTFHCPPAGAYDAAVVQPRWGPSALLSYMMMRRNAAPPQYDLERTHESSLLKPPNRRNPIDPEQQRRRSGKLPLTTTSGAELPDKSYDATGVNAGGNWQVYLISGAADVDVWTPGEDTLDPKGTQLRSMGESAWVAVGVQARLVLYANTHVYIVGGKFDLDASVSPFSVASSFYGSPSSELRRRSSAIPETFSFSGFSPSSFLQPQGLPDPVFSSAKNPVANYFFHAYTATTKTSCGNDVHVNDATGNGEGTAKAKDMVWSSHTEADPPNITVYNCETDNGNDKDPDRKSTEPFVWCHLHPFAAMYLAFRGNICFWTDSKECSTPGHARWTSPGLFYYETFQNSGEPVAGGYENEDCMIPDPNWGPAAAYQGDSPTPASEEDEGVGESFSSLEVSDAGDTTTSSSHLVATPASCSDPIIFGVSNFDLSDGEAGVPNFTSYPSDLSAIPNFPGYVVEEDEFLWREDYTQKRSKQCEWGYHGEQIVRAVQPTVAAVKNVRPPPRGGGRAAVGEGTAKRVGPGGGAGGGVARARGGGGWTSVGGEAEPLLWDATRDCTGVAAGERDCGIQEDPTERWVLVNKKKRE